MQKEEITQYVVKALGRHHSQNDIIQYLCEHAGMTWPEAEKLVKQIRIRHGSEIHTQQSPFIIALGITGIIGGLALVGFSIYSFFTFVGMDPMAIARNGRGIIAAAIMLIAGFGLITGALVGMWNRIKEFFENKENR
jgi:hypothetical protein